MSAEVTADSRPPLRVALPYPLDAIAAIRRCLHVLYDDASMHEWCHRVLTTEAYVTTIVFHGVDVELFVVNATDWSIDGPIVGGVLNDTFDAVLGLMTITHERVRAGVQFTNVIMPTASSIVRRELTSSSSNDVDAMDIVVGQFPDSVAWPLMSCVLVVLLLCVLRRHRSPLDAIFAAMRAIMPGVNTNSMPSTNRVLIVTASLLSLTLATIYQVTLAQSLMVVEGVDDETMAFRLIERVRKGRATIVFDMEAAPMFRLQTGTDVFSKAVRAATDRTPWRVERDPVVFRRLVAQGDHLSFDDEVFQFDYLQSLCYPQCLDYRVTRVPNYNIKWLAIGTSPKLPYERQQLLNGQITRRFEEISAAVSNFKHPSAMCDAHFKQTVGNKLEYTHLTVSRLSGCFWLVLLACFGGLVLLLSEHLVQRQRSEQPNLRREGVLSPSHHYIQTAASTMVTFHMAHLTSEEDCMAQIRTMLRQQDSPRNSV